RHAGTHRRRRVRRSRTRGGARDRLWHVHVADTNRKGLGRGHLDLAACAAALRDIGYAGAMVIEAVAPGPDPFRAIKDERSATIVDDFLRDSVMRLRGALPHHR